MRNSIYFLSALFMLVSCSPRKTDSPLQKMKEQEAVIKTNPVDDEEATVIKNTDSYHTVVIRNMVFEPAELTLHKGDTVLWINKDLTDHDITEEPGHKWSSPKIRMNESWAMVVDESAAYYCSIHVVMKGRLVVK